MDNFRVWDEDPADARDVRASGPADAAEEWVGRRHADLDYCSEHEVWVRGSDGTVTRWRVRVENLPSFHAEPLAPVV